MRLRKGRECADSLERLGQLPSDGERDVQPSHDVQMLGPVAELFA